MAVNDIEDGHSPQGLSMVAHIAEVLAPEVNGHLILRPSLRSSDRGAGREERVECYSAHHRFTASLPEVTHESMRYDDNTRQEAYA